MQIEQRSQIMPDGAEMITLIYQEHTDRQILLDKAASVNGGLGAICKNPVVFYFKDKKS